MAQSIHVRINNPLPLALWLNDTNAKSYVLSYLQSCNNSISADFLAGLNFSVSLCVDPPVPFHCHDIRLWGNDVPVIHRLFSGFFSVLPNSPNSLTGPVPSSCSVWYESLSDLRSSTSTVSKRSTSLFSSASASSTPSALPSSLPPSPEASSSSSPDIQSFSLVVRPGPRSAPLASTISPLVSSNRFDPLSESEDSDECDLVEPDLRSNSPDSPSVTSCSFEKRELVSPVPSAVDALDDFARIAASLAGCMAGLDADRVTRARELSAFVTSSNFAHSLLSFIDNPLLPLAGPSEMQALSIFLHNSIGWRLPSDSRYAFSAERIRRVLSVSIDENRPVMPYAFPYRLCN